MSSNILQKSVVRRAISRYAVAILPVEVFQSFHLVLASHLAQGSDPKSFRDILLISRGIQFKQDLWRNVGRDSSIPNGRPDDR